jgi:hypothetical protein
MRSTRSALHLAGLALLATTSTGFARELSCNNESLDAYEWRAVFPCNEDVCENESGSGTHSPFPGGTTSPGPMSPNRYVVPERIRGLREALDEMRQPATPAGSKPAAQEPGAAKPTAGNPSSAKANPGSGLPEAQNVYYATYIMSQYESPSPTSITCEDMGGSFLCEAFPQGDNVTYSWSTTGKVTQPYPNVPSAPMKTLGCNGVGGGSVTVTVYSPYGVTATATQSNLYCGY